MPAPDRRQQRNDKQEARDNGRDPLGHRQRLVGHPDQATAPGPRPEPWPSPRERHPDRGSCSGCCRAPLDTEMPNRSGDSPRAPRPGSPPGRSCGGSARSTPDRQQPRSRRVEPPGFRWRRTPARPATPGPSASEPEPSDFRRACIRRRRRAIPGRECRRRRPLEAARRIPEDRLGRDRRQAEQRDGDQGSRSSSRSLDGSRPQASRSSPRRRRTRRP